jgi:uncharacterized damage-inducible protein DinB
LTVRGGRSFLAGISPGSGAAMMLEHLRRMARYNAWANRRLYEACAQLPEVEYRKPRPAFFGSIHGTLNHLLVADRIWLARIEGKGVPRLQLDDQPCGTLAQLREARDVEDARMIQLVNGYGEDDLEKSVRYRLITQPDEAETPLHVCWLHLFNHQTHHRGQVHDQLSQTELAPPPLDLIFYLRGSGDPR